MSFMIKGKRSPSLKRFCCWILLLDFPVQNPNVRVRNSGVRVQNPNFGVPNPESRV